MAALVLDSVSARTLPHLDAKFQENPENLTELTLKTGGEALRRLTLAAISRHRFLGQGDTDNIIANFLEELITLNLAKQDGDGVNAWLDEVSEAVERNVLTFSILRYNQYDTIIREAPRPF